MASLGPLLSPDHVNRSNKRPSCLQGARSATPSGRCVHGRAIAAHYLVRACWEEPMSTLERYGPFRAQWRSQKFATEYAKHKKIRS